jgi:hypothetical protein
MTHWMCNQATQGQSQALNGLGQQNALGQLIHYQEDRPQFSHAYCPITDTVVSTKDGSRQPAHFKKSKEENMVTEVAQDLKKFIREHKSTIYIIAMLLIVDHFMFNGAMKEKLKSLVQNLVGKVEAKLNETKV